MIRIVVNKGKTPLLKTFEYMQLLFEPFIRGGLVTAISVPLLYNFGPWALLFIVLFFSGSFMILGLFYFKKLTPSIKTNYQMMHKKRGCKEIV